MMLSASCDNLKTEQGGWPQYNIKDTLLRNLCFLFKRVHGVHINPWNGTLKDFINKASDITYCNQLILCLLQPSKKISSHIETWNIQRQSINNLNKTNNEPPPTTPPHWRKEYPPPSPTPPHTRLPPPRRELTDYKNNQDYISNNIGRIMYDPLKVLGLGYSVLEKEVKVYFCSMSIINNPDKRKKKTEMTENYTIFFHTLKNAQSYFREVLWNGDVFVCGNYYTSTNTLIEVIISVTVTCRNWKKILYRS